MACDTQTLEGQTLTERKEEVKRAIDKFSAAVASGSTKVKVGPKGEVVFEGMRVEDRGRISDGCAYRMLMVRGSALAKAKIAAAEQASGRKINKQVVGQGWHSHDGGASFHTHKGGR